LFEHIGARRQKFLLYLPLYKGIQSLQIGVPASCRRLDPLVRPDKLVVFHGTSIVQSGCAARPGMAYPAILERRLDRPTVNLGFSGNGTAEPKVASLLAELDPAVYVPYCLPTLGLQEAKRVEPFVSILRNKRRGPHYLGGKSGVSRWD
jgi:hypothetical protein